MNLVNVTGSRSANVKVVGNVGGGFRVSSIPSSEMFLLSIDPKTFLVSAGSSSTVTTQDSVNTLTVDAVVWTYTDISLNIPLGDFTGAATFSTDNPMVASVGTDGTITPISPGTANVTASIQGLGVRKYVVKVSASGGTSHSDWVCYITGSLGRALQDEITALLSGRTPPSIQDLRSAPYPWSSQWNIYNETSSPSLQFTRNANGWWGGIDLTCISLCHFNGVLITPRDMIFAKHFGFGPDPATEPILFYDADNNLSERHAVAFSSLSNPSGDGADIWIATLNEDLPSSITPVSILPANFRSYLPNNAGGYPLVFTNQDHTLLTADLAGNSAMPSIVQNRQSKNAERMNWYYYTRVGDSGSPFFLIIDGKLSLLTYAHYVDSGPVLSDNIAQINSAIAANATTLGISPYTVILKDLSEFLSF